MHVNSCPPDDGSGAPSRDTPGTVLATAAQPLLAEGLRRTLVERGFAVVCATTAEAADQKLESVRPQWSVLVLDPPLPDASAEQAGEQLIGKHPQTASVVLLRRSDRWLVRRVTHHGAHGILHTGVDGDDLARSLARVAAGEIVIDASLFACLAEASALPTSTHVELGRDLTEHQVAALRLVAEGRTSKEIARALRITRSAADHAIERAAARLGAAHRSHAVALAIRSGLFG